MPLQWTGENTGEREGGPGLSRHLFDLIIVGAGPAGLAAAERAHASGLRYAVLERTDHLADTVHCYQKRKHVMAEPGPVPVRSGLPFAAGGRESVLAGWEGFVRERGLDVRFNQELVGLEGLAGGGFAVATRGDRFEAAHVVLALGTQGNPRRLGVPGEELPHVATRLVDPDEVRDLDVLVVGGGDSALEVALGLADHNRVALVVRGAEIVRAKESLERDVLSRAATGQLKIHFSTTLKLLAPGVAELAGPEGDLRVAADRVFLKLGATPPRKLLEGFGARFAGEGREAQPILTYRYESSVPGLFMIGAVAGRDLIKLGINQGYEVVEHILGHEVEPADEAVLRERLPAWSGTVRERIATVQEEIPLFAAAGEAQLRELFLSTRVLRPADGEVILRQNDFSDSFLVITGGRVAISMRAEGDAAERPVATLAAGNFFGEMSLISNRRRNATAVALDQGRLIEIPRKAMLKLLATAPEVKTMVDRTFLVRAFQGYLFPELSEAELWPLVARATVEARGKDEVLFREGDEADAFYLIRSGMVKISKRSGEREIVLSYLVAGNFFGEIALLPDARRTATVTTIFPSELIRLAKRDIDDFLAAHPGLREGFLAKLEERRIATLVAEATPGSGEVLSDLIREEVVMGTDALLIDEHKCIRCNNCIHACEGVHDDGQARLSLTGIKFYNLLAPNSCWQCEDPQCMLDCPPDAIVRDPRGQVQIKSNCIGCGNCEANCPYDNIFMVHPAPQPSLFGWVRRLFQEAESANQTVAVKCDLCRDLAGGPACVRSCPTGAAIRLSQDEYRQTIEELVVARGGK